MYMNTASCSFSEGTSNLVELKSGLLRPRHLIKYNKEKSGITKIRVNI